MSKGPKQPTGKDRLIQDQLRAGGAIPRHIAIIMDGNGRWAKERGMPRIAGHTEGVESVRDIIDACAQLGVEHLTLYTFSTENWKRPKDEVSLLMRLLVKALRDEADRLFGWNVRIKAIGQIGKLPEEVQAELREGITRTRENNGLTLILALSYSGRWELTEAVRKIADDVAAGRLAPEEIGDEHIASRLSTAGIPDPDLLVRTSGELRLSNFLLWQLAYTEIFITPRYWPAFRRSDLYAAIRDFQRRERRFGQVSEQLAPPAKTEQREPARAAGSVASALKRVTGS